MHDISFIHPNSHLLLFTVISVVIKIGKIIHIISNNYY